jgi:Fe-S cluster biosynthesis and repair protein YggX
MKVEIAQRSFPMGCGSAPPMPEPERPGARKVFCVKFQREMEGLDEPPFDTHPLGQRIYENVSKEAWKLWLEQMKMIMNEYRLNLGNPEAQEFLLKQMEDYFFGEGATFPPGFVPPQAKV